jgi:ankyrin repeat protein
VNGEVKVADLLLKSGANASFYGESSDVEEVAANMGIRKVFGPPLHIAALMGNVEIVRWLLENGIGDGECELAGTVCKWIH